MTKPILSGPRFLNTVLLGQDTPAKLKAASQAGFDQVELWVEDLDGIPSEDARQLLGENNLGLTDLQVLLDFDGSGDASRVEKYQEAERLLTLAAGIGARTVLVPANTALDADASLVRRDLRWLCRRADQRGLRVAYEGMAWSRFNSTVPAAWRQIEQVEASNLDLVIDAYHLFASGRQVDDLLDLPVERIALVQLSDVASQPEPGQVKNLARHQRCLPGQGIWPLHDLVRALCEMSYQGPVGIEVFNDQLKAMKPRDAAELAWGALEALLGPRPSPE